MCTGDDCAKLGVVKVGEAGNSTAFDFNGDLLARFDFGGRFDGDNYPSVSSHQQTKFQADFLAQVAAVLPQLRKFKLLAPDALLPPRMISGPYQPRTDFHIFVSELYHLSKSLVPAWSGQRGWMEFPAHRVVAGDASIAHEVVHVLCPNGNRMLAEGLAVHLQHKLSDVPVYPNFGVPLDDTVVKFLVEKYNKDAPSKLWQMNLEAFEKISTPDELGLRLGDGIIGARPGFGPQEGDQEIPADEGKAVYEVAGSLVGFLLDNPIGDDLLTASNFGALYLSTPLRPFERDSGVPERWQDYYKDKHKAYSFADLGLLWKTYMHEKFFSAGKIPIPAKFQSIPLVDKLAKQLQSKGRATGRK
jgi:hypothetical protein